MIAILQCISIFVLGKRQKAKACNKFSEFKTNIDVPNSNAEVKCSKIAFLFSVNPVLFSSSNIYLMDSSFKIFLCMLSERRESEID